MVERGRKIRRSPIELKQGAGHAESINLMCPRWIGSGWEHGNVLPAGNQGSS
jgi:hypothetical protein